MPVKGVHEDAKPFLGSNVQTSLRDLETRMRKSAADLEFETAAPARRTQAPEDARPVILGLDPGIANDLMTAAGEAVDDAAPGRMRKAAQAEA